MSFRSYGRMVRLALILLCVSCLAENNPGVAATIQVDSLEALHASLSDAAPGDEIVLADGEYRNARLRIHGQGMEGKPILVRAQTVGGVRFTGKSDMRLWGRFITVQGFNFEDGYSGSSDVIAFRRAENSSDVATDSRLTRCTINNFNNPGDRRDHWVSIYGRRNRVDHCYIANKTTDGTTLVVWLDGEPNNHRIDHNHFGFRQELGKNGGETIRVGTSGKSLTSSATLVENNLFEECDGEIEIISSKSCDNIYRGNTFDNCNGMLTLRHGNRCLVENNVFIGQGKRGGGGVRVIGEDHTVAGNHMQNLIGTDDFRSALTIMNGQPNNPLNGYARVKNAVFNGNVLIDCTQPLTIGTGIGRRNRTLAPKDLNFINNLFINRKVKGPYDVLAKPEGITASGNRVVGGRPPASLRAEKLKGVKLITQDDGLMVPEDIETLSQAGYAPRRLTPRDVGPDAPQLDE